MYFLASAVKMFNEKIFNTNINIYWVGFQHVLYSFYLKMLHFPKI